MKNGISNFSPRGEQEHEKENDVKRRLWIKRCRRERWCFDDSDKQIKIDGEEINRKES